MLADHDQRRPRDSDMRGEIRSTTTTRPRRRRSRTSHPEGNAGLVDLVFAATLAAPPHSAVTFNYRTVADTANTTDYDAASGSKLFPANSTTTATKVPITVKVKGDLLDEVDETLKLELLKTTSGRGSDRRGHDPQRRQQSKLSIKTPRPKSPGR